MRGKDCVCVRREHQIALEPLWVMSNQNMPDGVSRGWRAAHPSPDLFPAISSGMAAETLVANVLPNLLVITVFLLPTPLCHELIIFIPNPHLSVSRWCNTVIIKMSYVPGQLGKTGELKKAFALFHYFLDKRKYCLFLWNAKVFHRRYSSPSSSYLVSVWSHFKPKQPRQTFFFIF